MLNFHLPSDTDIYLYLNEQYKFSSKIDRSEIKMDFFKYIYGTKCYDSELSNIINKFKDSLFNIFQNFGYVKSFFLKRKVFFNSKTINQSNILFNYFLQNAETEYNLLKIQKILSNVPQQNCKLVLYTYDSFLFEIDKNQPQLIEQIKSILQEDGIPVTIQVGTNYGNLVDIY
jgi:neutral trehalase